MIILYLQINKKCEIKFSNSFFFLIQIEHMQLTNLDRFSNFRIFSLLLHSYFVENY